MKQVLFSLALVASCMCYSAALTPVVCEGCAVATIPQTITYEDIFDVKMSIKTQVISGGAVYKSVTYKGELYVAYTNEGYPTNCYAVLKDSKTKTEKVYNVDVIHGSVIGKKFSSPNMACRIYDDDGRLDLICAGSGKFTTKSKDSSCDFCCGSSGPCQKPNFSGNVVGIADCLCGESSYGEDLAKCGRGPGANGRAACYGSFSIKWNKKKSN